jgi:hypothetical protein
MPTGGFIPALKLEPELKNYESNLLLIDFYSKYYKRFGILRDEMMAVMPSMMISDVLTGLDDLDYVE